MIPPTALALPIRWATVQHNVFNPVSRLRARPKGYRRISHSFIPGCIVDSLSRSGPHVWPVLVFRRESSWPVAEMGSGALIVSYRGAADVALLRS
jgi:hypothetical protein